MKPSTFKRSLLSVAVTCTMGTSNLAMAEDDVVELDNFVAEEVVDDLNLLPTEPVSSIFGFDKTLLETPRSATSISAETIDAYGISDIDDLVILSPGAFTQSFFGVAGSLDVRGTPGETYFRGVRRLDNPGNYPTPIGASDRIDIVRGPASPIYGPSKIGGYLNFVPKSARAETGQYLDKPIGAISVTRGSWDKSILTAEVGGPAEFMGKTTGYYFYTETENSGSYYDNSATDQNLYQASFNMDLSANSRIEFGGMYHEYDGNQVAGWNRLTQDLIDTGTYITGTAQPADLNGDGVISHQEYGYFADAAGPDTFIVGTSGITDGDIPAAYALENPGTAKLKGSQTLVSPTDQLLNDVFTLYFDYIFEGDSGLKITNKMFYESYENLNENAYGFSQFHDSYVIEDQLIFAYTAEMDGLTANFQFEPSIRYTDFKHGDDYSHELFDRRDLTMPSSALDRRLLATEIDDDYTEYYVGNYTDYGLAFLTDLDFDFGLNIVAGIRQDFLDVESNTPVDKLLCPIIDENGNFQSLSANYFSIACADVPEHAEDSTDGLSWTFSVSYDLPFGITPYVTASEQSTIIAGQGADISVDNIIEEGYFDTSELVEFGVKGSLLNDSLYFALAVYDMERTDFSAQSAVTNQSVQTEGVEFELRYVVNQNLSLTVAYTEIEATNLNTQENGGSRFSFVGAEDLVNVTDPSLFYGGQYVGIVSGSPIKAGIPETSYGLSANYDFLNGFSSYISLFHADETASGHSKAVILPSYDLVNAGVSYSGESWRFSIAGKNLTDEQYYRSNFAALFGTQIVLPELPRHYSATMEYKF